jgi:hypothetical protein
MHATGAAVDVHRKPPTRPRRRSELDPEPGVSTHWIPADALQRRLGVLPWKVWVVFLQLRNEKGIAFPGYRFLARHLHTNRKDLSVALRKLQRVGLVKAVGPRHPRQERNSKHRPSMARRCHGCLVQNGTFVPNQTLHWFKTSKEPSWGGARKGAGRPKKVVFKIPHKSGAEEFKIPADSSPLEKNPKIFYYVKDGARSAPQQTEREKPMLVTRTKLGLGFGGIRGPQRPDPRTLIARGWVPAEPNPRLIGEVIRPSPPLLPADLDEYGAVMWLVQAYRGAVRTRYQQSCQAFRFGDIRKSKSYSMLASAASALRDYEIAPAAWATWMVEGWRERRSTQPPVQFVFSPKVIEEKHGWFRRESTGYTSQRLVFTEAGLALIHKHHRLMFALRALPGTTWEEGPVRAVVNSYFPNGTYPALVEDARNENMREQNRLSDEVARGEYVW